MTLTERVYNFITAHQMLTPGDEVLAAVSGGPDSVALLHILHSLREQLGIGLCVAHLDHMFRGEESQADAQFVVQLCRDMHISCLAQKVNVTKYGREHKLSSQVAARDVRYRFLDQAAERFGANKIAFGHHADDQAETVLLNLLRGAGPTGISGIAPVRDNRYIRPLLAVRRKEIEEYCHEQGLSYRIDSSNKKTVYLRNKIRLQLIPQLEHEYNPEIVTALGRLAELNRVEDHYLELKTEEILNRLAQIDNEKIQLPVSELNCLQLALQRRVIRLAWQNLTGKNRDLSYHHVQAVLEQCKDHEPSTVQLPGGVNCKIYQGKITFAYSSPQGAVLNICCPLVLPGQTKVEELGIVVQTAVCSRQQFRANPAKLPINEAAFDYDKISDRLYVRTRRKGDRFTPQGAGGTVKLKKFFIDQKVPREKRHSIPLICTQREIIWVSGLRVGEYWKVTERTSKVLHICIQPLN